MATFKVFLFLFSFQKFEYGVWCSCFCWVGAKVLSPQGWGQGSLPPGGSKSPVSIWFLWGERCSSPLGLEHAWGRGHFAAWVMRLGLAEQGCFICHFLSCWAVPVLVLWQKEQLLGFFFFLYMSPFLGCRLLWFQNTCSKKETKPRTHCTSPCWASGPGVPSWAASGLPSHFLMWPPCSTQPFSHTREEYGKHTALSSWEQSPPLFPSWFTFAMSKFPGRAGGAVPRGAQGGTRAWSGPQIPQDHLPPWWW